MNLIPQYQLGYLAPSGINDNVYYQLYRVWPGSCMLIPYPMNLGGLSSASVNAALETNFWKGFDYLIARGVHRISLGGIPLSALAGRSRILQLIAQAAERSAVPVSSDFEESIAAFQSLGVRRIALAAKWDAALLQAVTHYLAQAGIEVLASEGEPHTLQQSLEVNSQQGVRLARELGERALARAPLAEGLLIAGGGWLSMQPIPELEARYDIPVITNPCATCWAAMRQFGVASPEVGWGSLIDGLRANP